MKKISFAPAVRQATKHKKRVLCCFTALIGDKKKYSSAETEIMSSLSVGSVLLESL